MVHQDHPLSTAAKHCDQLLVERAEAATALREVSRSLDSMLYWHDATSEPFDSERMVWSRESLAQLRRLLDAAMAVIPGRNSDGQAAG